MTNPRVSAIAAEFGVTLIDKHRDPAPGETRAVNTLSRILNRHGEDHLRMVLTTLAETDNNKASLDEASLWATSDLVRACKGIIDADASQWLSLWDAMPVGQMQRLTRDLSGLVPRRHALAALLYERIVRRFGPGAAQPDLFDDRRMPT